MAKAEHKSDDMGPTSGLTPHIVCKGALDAIAFYKKAFGAKQRVLMMAPDGARVMHAHLEINKASLMLCDDFPEYRGGASVGEPSGVTLHLQVGNADKAFDKALSAGASVAMPIADQFWGDRYGQVKDPFGHTWSIAAPLSKKAAKAAAEAWEKMNQGPAAEPAAPAPAEKASKAAKKAAKTAKTAAGPAPARAAAKKPSAKKAPAKKR